MIHSFVSLKIHWYSPYCTVYAVLEIIVVGLAFTCKVVLHHAVNDVNAVNAVQVGAVHAVHDAHDVHDVHAVYVVYVVG
jgi:hypothetical protein